MARVDCDVAVVGAGPGGLVAALYLRRFLRSVALLNGGSPRASWIPRTHNLLGYTRGISGPRLLKKLEEQVDELGVDRVQGFFRVERSEDGFKLTDGTKNVSARKVILATGMTDVQPPLENLGRLRQRGLLRYCPVCDAFEYKNKSLVVLAQDTHGVKTAVFLSAFTSKLHVVWPLSQSLPKELLAACRKRGIRIHCADLKSLEEKTGGGLWVTLEGTGRAIRFSVDAGYVALGVVVNDSAFRHLRALRRNDEGYLVTGSHQELPVPGLFAIGDCVEGLAQISVAAGHAAVAATRIHNQLRAKL